MTVRNEKQLKFASIYICRVAILACIIIFKHISSCRKRLTIKTALRQNNVQTNKDCDRRCTGFGDDVTKKSTTVDSVLTEQIRLAVTEPVE